MRWTQTEFGDPAIKIEKNSLCVFIKKASKGFLLTCEQFIERPVDDVFDFFQNAMNLEKVTPPFLHFRLLTEPPIEMRVGALIDYQIKLHGIPVKWRTEITDWEPTYRFVDQQLRGPYRWWIHEHTFTGKDGGTLMTDSVQYGVPFGRLVNRWIVEKDVRRIFEYRYKTIKAIFADKAGMAI